MCDIPQQIKYVIKCRPVHVWQTDEEPPSDFIDYLAYDWAPYPSDDPNKIKFVNVYLDEWIWRRPLRDRVTGRFTYLIAAVDPDVWNSYPPQTPGLIDRTYQFKAYLHPILPMLRETPTNMSVFIMNCPEDPPKDHPRTIPAIGFGTMDVEQENFRQSDA